MKLSTLALILTLVGPRLMILSGLRAFSSFSKSIRLPTDFPYCLAFLRQPSDTSVACLVHLN